MKTPDTTTILYDLDGTLVHSAPDLIHALNHALAPVGLPDFGNSDVGHIVGQGAMVMISKGLERHGHNPEDHDLDLFLDRFLEHYEENMTKSSYVFDGVVDTLEHFARLGLRQAVCTNKRQSFSEKMLNELGLTPHFDAIVGADRVSRNKPDAAHILETLALAGGTPDAAVMIGDSINDVLAAKNANVPVIAVTFGYTDIPAHELGADATVDRFSQIQDAYKAFVQH